MDKNYDLIIEKYAQKDIQDIYNYISYTLLNKEAAIKLLNNINKKLQMIKTFPKSAPLINNQYVKNKNIMKLLVDNYILFYEVDDNNNEIRIIRVLYGMRNYINIL